MKLYITYLLLSLYLISFYSQADEELQPNELDSVISDLIQRVYLQDNEGNEIYQEHKLNKVLNSLNTSLQKNSSSVKLHLTYILALETKLSAKKMYGYPDDSMLTYFRRQESKDIVKSILNSCKKSIASWNSGEALSYNMLIRLSRNGICRSDLKTLIHDYVSKEYPLSQFNKPVELLSSDLMCNRVENSKATNETYNEKTYRTIISDIKTIQTAIDVFYFDNYEFPTNEQGLSILAVKPKSADSLLGWRKYLKKIKPDPNGNAYKYLIKNKNNGYIIATWSESIINGCQVGYRTVYEQKKI